VAPLGGVGPNVSINIAYRFDARVKPVHDGLRAGWVEQLNLSSLPRLRLASGPVPFDASGDFR
jgi:hypothetical protein